MEKKRRVPGLFERWYRVRNESRYVTIQTASAVKYHGQKPEEHPQSGLYMIHQAALVDEEQKVVKV